MVFARAQVRQIEQSKSESQFVRTELIVKLFGGLGNQMFQYAAGRALSLRQGRRLLIDATAYQRCRYHQGFEIKKVFQCPVGIASPERLRAILGLACFEPVQRLLTKPLGRKFLPEAVLLEPHFHYWRGFSSETSCDFMRGYWQSEKYFESIRDILLDDFAFRIPLDVRNLETQALISSSNSVSVHVRRGDYVHNAEASATHGFCSIEYYRRAIRFMKASLDDPKLFFFSDDIEWVRDHLDLGGECRFVDWNTGADSYNDMRLMSLCKHNIIANSSFSWWGAWLNQNPGKIIIAPTRWFAAAIDDSDLIPLNWRRM